MGERASIVIEYSCERCRHTWKARKAGRPQICPKCKSPLWDIPRRKK